MASIKSFLSFLFVFICINVNAEERILSYHSDIEIQQDRSVIITENIKIIAEGYIFKRGIYRDIPTSYELKGGQKYRVGFDLISVTKNGEKELYKKDSRSNGIRIYVGDEDVFLEPGEYSYSIKYKVDNVLGIFQDFDELTWNVNGNGWDVRIDAISANVIYPNGAGLVQTAVYTGVYGDTQTEANITDRQGEVQFRGRKEMNPREGMTVSVAWDKGFINYPTAVEKSIQKIQSLSVWIVSIFGLLLTLVFNTFFWLKKGKDPERGIVIPQFTIPEGLTPADCAYVDNKFRYRSNSYGATIVNLAVQKHISIKDEQEKKLLFVNRQKYIFSKLDEGPKSPENQVEKEFFNDLFGSEQELEVVRKEYNENVLNARKGLMENLRTKHEGVNVIRNYALTFMSSIIPIISIALGFFCLVNYGGHFGVIASLMGFMIAIGYFFSRWFQKPTEQGTALMDYVAGLKKYLKYTEEDRLKILNPPDFSFEHFEKMLPYAIALNLADEWQHQFEVVNPTEARNHTSFMWFNGNNVNSYRDFDFNDVSDTISSAAIPPSTSSSSGGGGFSGGGGGGGGGGGW
ncbi:Predicted membrane protein [Spirosomataceae bacterium TFI 002]|nr:Predicted membrane protein [Spirosomataceae bacterium TFI 002]